MSVPDRAFEKNLRRITRNSFIMFSYYIINKFSCMKQIKRYVCNFKRDKTHLGNSKSFTLHDHVNSIAAGSG